MNSLRITLLCLIGALGVALSAGAVDARAAVDGAHDFDFNSGTWTTHITRLVQPLSGSKETMELRGTVAVRPVWGGRAQLEEIEADGPAGHFEGLTVFLYNPATHEWSLYFASSQDGSLNTPSIGEFRGGRGEFYNSELYHGRQVLVRIVWSDIHKDSHRFEQSFSADGGRTWEPNFSAILTRNDAAVAQAPGVAALPAVNHDFDWQFGTFKVHMTRQPHPLTSDDAWTELDGTVAVRPVWGGRANLAEVVADGPSGHLEFLSLRLYDPQAQQWSLNFASSSRGIFGMPMVGAFHDGRGEFYSFEPVNERMTWTRFVFADLKADSHRDEQAFSADGGRSWDVNWRNASRRAGQPAR
jgi:hypothetical protein